MSAIVEVWFGELTKLGEKVRAHNLPLLTKPKEGTDQKEAHHHNNKESMAVPRDTSGGSMSESTVCLLMDRFVPW